MPLPLERYSSRTLNLLGSLLSGQDARVVLTRRLQPAATTVLESRTVMLDPTRTGLYDLALCARLLRLRPQFREEPDRLRRVPRKRLRGWAREAQASLHRDYPGILRLPGRFQPGRSVDGLQVTWMSVAWTPLDPDQIGPVRPELRDIPEVEVAGAEDDYAWLRGTAERGRFPLEYLPGLEELPVATVPLRLCFSEAYGPRVERLEETIALNRHLVNGLLTCYRRKSETLQEAVPLGRHTLSGQRLDSTRLVEAVLARRTGLQPRLFRERNASYQPVFDPRQHLVVMALDLNDLRRGTLDDPSFSHRLLGCMIEVYRALGVDFLLLGFADQVLDLADGRRIYLHVPVTLKGIDDDFDGAFWSRVAHVMEHPPILPGERACYHPLPMRTIGRLMDRVAQEWRHSYRAVIFGMRRGMPRGSPEFHTAEFLSHTANALDEQITGMRQRLRGTLDTLAAFVPWELKNHARSGGAVAEMYT
jgi:hypothetical protein